jgi:hypothetical protein
VSNEEISETIMQSYGEPTMTAFSVAVFSAGKNLALTEELIKFKKSHPITQQIVDRKTDTESDITQIAVMNGMIGFLRNNPLLLQNSHIAFPVAMPPYLIALGAHGHASLLNDLHNQGKSFTADLGGGMTLLGVIAMSNHTHLIPQLLSYGTDFNAKNVGKKLLETAIIHERWDMYLALLPLITDKNISYPSFLKKPGMLENAVIHHLHQQGNQTID